MISKLSVVISYVFSWQSIVISCPFQAICCSQAYHFRFINFSLIRLFRSICLAPVHHLLRRLSAADAGLAQVLLLEGHAAGCRRGVFLDLVLAGLVAAPHGFHEARLVDDRVLNSRNRSLRRCGRPVCSCPLQHIVLHRLQQLLTFAAQLFEGRRVLFSGIAAADDGLAVLDILRSASRSAAECRASPAQRI